MTPELDPMEWMKEVVVPDEADSKLPQDTIQRLNTYRFDFNGHLLSHSSSLSIPTHIGLHHHGEDPALAGYSLKELIHLIQSTVPGQIVICLKIIGNIIENCKKLPDFANGDGRFVIKFLLDLGLGLALRVALDKKNMTNLGPAIKCLHELILDTSTEAVNQIVSTYHRGYETYSLCPQPQNPSGTQDNTEPTPDFDKIQSDLILGFLSTGLLGRLRYFLEVIRVPEPHASMVLDVLLRFAVHSPDAAGHLLECPRLMYVISTFFIAGPIYPMPIKGHSPDTTLPTSYPYDSAQPKALQIIRAICTAKVEYCKAIISSKVITTSDLSRFLSPLMGSDTQGDTLGITSHQLCLETLELLNVWWRYGLSLSLFDTLFPVFAKNVSWILSINSKFLFLESTRIFMLLETVVRQFQTSGGELQKSLPIEWSHVSPFFQQVLFILDGLNRKPVQNWKDLPKMSKVWVADCLRSLLHFLATYLSVLIRRIGNSMDTGDKMNVPELTETSTQLHPVVRFLTSNPFLLQIVDTICTGSTEVRMNTLCAGLSLPNHPSFELRSLFFNTSTTTPTGNLQSQIFLCPAHILCFWGNSENPQISEIPGNSGAASISGNAVNSGNFSITLKPENSENFPNSNIPKIEKLGDILEMMSAYGLGEAYVYVRRAIRPLLDEGARAVLDMTVGEDGKERFWMDPFHHLLSRILHVIRPSEEPETVPSCDATALYLFRPCVRLLYHFIGAFVDSHQISTTGMEKKFLNVFSCGLVLMSCFMPGDEILAIDLLQKLNELAKSKGSPDLALDIDFFTAATITVPSFFISNYFVHGVALEEEEKPENNNSDGNSESSEKNPIGPEKKSDGKSKKTVGSFHLPRFGSQFPLPYDWIFLMFHNVSLPAHLQPVKKGMRLIFNLEQMGSPYTQSIPIPQKIMHLLHIYLLDSDTWSDPETKKYLKKLLRLYTSRGFMNEPKNSAEPVQPFMNMETAMGDAQYFDFVQKISAVYAAESYGCVQFGQCLQFLMQRGLPAGSKVPLWLNIRLVWHLLLPPDPKGTKSYTLLPLSTFLCPVEDDTPLLEEYVKCLCENKGVVNQYEIIQAYSFVYWFIIHHLASYIWIEAAGKDPEWKRQRLFAEIVESVQQKEVIYDLFYYSSHTLFGVCSEFDWIQNILNQKKLQQDLTKSKIAPSPYHLQFLQNIVQHKSSLANKLIKEYPPLLQLCT